MTMIIDSHQHYWTIQRTDYGWLTPETGILYRDYLPEHMRPELERFGVRKTVVVQAAPTVAETEYMLGLCEREPTLAGVVGWLDFESAEFPRELARLRRNRYFVGVRPMIQDLPDDWLLREQVVRNFRHVEEQGFTVDLQLRPRLFPNMIRLMSEVSGLKAVVDHLGKPFIWSCELDPWRGQLAELASFPNVMCKLSGMVPEAEGRTWEPEQIKPYAQYALATFGPDRVMFGSDWPVCLQSATYEQVIEALRGFLPDEWGEHEQAALFGGNAARFYGLAE